MRYPCGLVLSCLLTACSTDTFTGDDAGDGGSDAGGDGTTTDATKGDAIASDAGNCLNGGQTGTCGNGGWCTNANDSCCATDNGAQCTNNPCNGTSFACRNAADCTTADAAILTCCLNNATITADVCPRQIKGGQAACLSLCAGFKLCSTSSECGGNKLCERANIGGTTQGISFGICL